MALRTAARAAVVVWLVAFTLRLIFIVSQDVAVGVDGSEYLALAQNLRWHDVFSYGAPHKWGDRGILGSAGPFLPTAARAPLYPVMIALLWWHDAPPFFAIRIVQAVLGAFTAVFTYLMARRLFDRRAALLAGLAVALGPYNALLTAAFVSDTLFCFLLAGGLWAWGRRNFVVAGLLLGAATLARAILLPILLFIGVLALLFKFNRLPHAKIALAALVIIGPWTARNLVMMHTFVPVSTMGWGANILLGTRPVAYGSGNPFFTYVKDEAFMGAIQSSADETEAEAKMIRAGLERIKQAPLHWLLVRVTQYPRLFVETPSYLFPYLPFPPKVITAAYFAGTFLFLALSAAGLVLSLSRWREVYPLALFQVAIAGAFFVGAAEERYSLAMLPMMAVFAGSAISRLLGRRKAA